MSTNPDVLAAAVDRPWLAYHIFYGGNPVVLLQECVLPLAARLEQDGLVSLSFYINYWLEGGHVRLRLLPAGESVQATIHQRAESAIRQYLERRPSMHPMARIESGSYYESMYALEYGDEERERYFNPDGSARLRPNNTVERRAYEPELDRYGGPVGMVICEDFFADSTRLAREVIELGNTNTRTILLGVGSEIMAVTVAGLLCDRSLVAAFLHGYHARWAGSYGMSSSYTEADQRPRYRRTVALLRESVVPMIDTVLAGKGSELPGFLGGWADACARYRRRIEAAVLEGALVFRDPEGNQVVPELVSDAAWRLCHSLVHMTNNRLLVSIEDEAYLAFELLEALKAETPEVAA